MVSFSFQKNGMTITSLHFTFNINSLSAIFPSQCYLEEAVDHFKHAKTPGVDGIVAEFYQVYWEQIAESFSAAVQDAFTKKKLHISACRGILSLIPKKSKNTLEVKNWRPLTLLTIDYKIISKALDNCLKQVLPYLIEPYQTGFMEGRNILTNIIKLMQIMTNAQRQKIAGLVLAIDFEKCFDCVEHTAVKGALEYYGFGPNFIQWIMILFTEFEVCTQKQWIYFSLAATH